MAANFDIEDIDIKRLAHRILNCDYPKWVFHQSYTLKAAISYQLYKMGYRPAGGQETTNAEYFQEDLDMLWEILNQAGVRDKFIKKYLTKPT